MARWQTGTPWRVLLATLLATGVGAWAASGLGLRTDLEVLLPQDQPSVRELKRVSERVAGVSQVFVVLQATTDGQLADLRRIGDETVRRLRLQGAPLVLGADDGIQEIATFVRNRAGLFADMAGLEDLRDQVKARERSTFKQAVGADLADDLDDDADRAPLTAKEVQRILFDGKGSVADRYPDGYFQSADGRSLVVVAQVAALSGQMEQGQATLDLVRNTVDQVVSMASPGAPIKIGYAGNLVTGLAEYRLLREDLVGVGGLGVGLILVAILLFFRRLRALVVLGAAIAVGCTFTFAVAALVIGHLNLATAFLISVVAGNGVNAGIVWTARFFEERRRGLSAAEAVLRAHATTWAPTLVAALAAAGAYAALAVTTLRAFRDFALIGAAGMVLCWTATVVVVPALLVIFDGWRPLVRVGVLRKPFFDTTRVSRFGAPFAALTARIPGFLLLGGALLSVVSLILAVGYLRRDPLEYDLKKLQSDPSDENAVELYRTQAVAEHILGAQASGALVILADSTAQARALAQTLRAHRDVGPANARAFGEVQSLADFVPMQQAEKADVVRELRRRLQRARDRGAVADEDWNAFAPLLDESHLKPFAAEDLPEFIKRLFRERDGTLGRLVFVQSAEGRSDVDLRYLLEFAGSIRETRLPDGTLVQGTGRAVIFADIFAACLQDMPRALLLSLGLTMATVGLLFRSRFRDGLQVIGSLIAGVICMMGLLAITNSKLNFINFIALPVTFGIGVDYAVNVMHRARSEADGALGALRTSGGAVVLCSMTTMLGYVVLLRAHNQAVRGLGAIAVLGEITCLLSAMLILPAWLLRRQRRAPKSLAVPTGAQGVDLLR